MNRREKLAFYTSTILLICLVLTPLPVFGRRTLNSWINFLFTTPTRWMRQNLFKSSPDFDGFYTDSLNYILLLFFGILIGVILVYVLDKIAKSQLQSLLTIFNMALIYYLAWIFLIYGFSKIYGNQFPEIPMPDIAISSENQDLQFWIWMGSQPKLVIILGLIEIAIGISLFSEKTRKFGLTAYILSMVLILSVNAYFGIGVLVFSLLLLFGAMHAFLQNNVKEPKFLLNPFAKSMQLFIACVVVILAYFHQKS